MLRAIMREKMGSGLVREILDKLAFEWTPEHGSEPIQLHGRKTLGWYEVSARALRYAWHA